MTTSILPKPIRPRLFSDVHALMNMSLPVITIKLDTTTACCVRVQEYVTAADAVNIKHMLLR